MILALIIITIIIAVLSGLAYRYGGSSGGQRWVREIGVAVCIATEMLILGIFNVGTLGCFGSVWIETTYFKKNGSDAKWWNWLLVGLSFSIATLPWFLYKLIAQHSLSVGYFIRIPVCAGLTVLWQEILSDKIAKLFRVTKDKTDEGGRGALQILTIPLLLI